MKRFECRAILFDLDGVLVDSTRYVEEQWRHWALGKGLSPEAFLRVCHGRRALETIQLAAPHLDAAAEVAAFVPPDDSDTNALEPLDGAAHLLRLLPEGCWAVATSGTRATARERLRRAGLPVPEILVCAEDVARGKPSPDVYLMAAAGLNVPPSDCIVIEDAPAGIEAARAARMRVIALTTTHQCGELSGDACAPSLAGVHLGRIDRGNTGTTLLELLIVDS
ncbi:MAG TPA: HAD-IA family hydrolase [Gemmatimonadales bacterium]|nr:HAD-IA family hydrolase [Gemmatimonadales bacterium]